MVKSRKHTINKESFPEISLHKRIVSAAGTGPRDPYMCSRASSSSVEVSRNSYRIVRECSLGSNETSETMIKSRSGQVFVVKFHGRKPDIKS